MKPSDKTLRQLGVSFITEINGVSEYRLNANSLKIILAPDPSSRVAAIVQHIRVGSRHEGAGNTGYSHILEHELFKGTPTFNAAKGNGYDDFMKLMGGVYNATTSNDRTNYYAKVPSAFVRHYLAYEADRLRNAILTDEDLATEMPVVVDEFDIGENDPDDLLRKQLDATMFTEHPYKGSVIGARSEVMKVTAAALKERLYDVYYWPNNTSLIIAGGIDVEQVLRDIVDLYGSIPASPRPIPQPYTVEPKQFGERRFVINKPGDLPRVMMGFHIPEADHEDSYALSALGIILGGTESSRIHNRLVNKGLASQAYSYASAMHDPDKFVVYAKLNPGIKTSTVERIMLREIAKISAKLVSQKEFEQVMELNANGTVHTKANRMKFAMSLSEHEATADWMFGQNYDPNFEKITREDILRVAKKYLTADNRSVGYFLPTGNPQPKAPKPQKQGSTDLISGDRKRLIVTPIPMESHYATDVKRTVLANGLTVLLLPTATQAVGVNLVLNAGAHCAPADKRIVSRMVAEMLSEGSARYSKAKIADFAARLGIKFGFGSDVFKTSTMAQVPNRLPEFLDILADVVRNPLFPADELALLKTSLSAELAEQAIDPEVVAFTALRRELYAPGDAFYSDTIEEKAAQVQAVTVDDLRAFHQTAYGPNGGVLTLVGKFDADEMLKLIEAKFGSWSGGIARPAQVKSSTAASKAERINVQIDGKDNLTILVGLPADLSTTSEDFLAASVANKALGGDTLNARLGMEIREKRGLTYGIISRFSDTTFGGAPWFVKMTTNGGNIGLALPLISKVVSNFATTGIGESELAAEKIGMSTAFDLALDGPMEIASTLTQYEYSGQGLAAMDSFQARLAAVTKEQVDAAIRKYFRVENATTVVAGELPA